MGIIENIYNQNEPFVKNENFAGVKKVIVDNYSDDVHFVYELLQNADDVSATEISFELKNDKLLVTHNGTPFTENDLKAICSISKGTKAGDYTKIGRFGIGFKSVFVYTDSPQIYSGNYSFEIRDLVMPKNIPPKKSVGAEKTLFIIPFNAAKTKKDAYTNIYGKLEALSDEAILFLKHILVIKIKIWLTDGSNEELTVSKNVLSEERLVGNEDLQRVCISSYVDDQYYWLLTKNNIELIDQDDNGKKQKVKQSIKIAFTEDNEELCPCSEYHYDKYENYYVFFPTRIQSNCEFLIHAPFITKSSRDTIALNNEANDTLKRNLGILIADSLYHFVKRNMLTMELIDQLYYGDHKDTVMWDSYTERLCELISLGKAIVPCENNTGKAVENVLFTRENEKIYSTLIKLLGKPWLADYYSIPESFGVCKTVYYSDFYEFLTENSECKELCLQEIVESLKAPFYSEKSSQWFIDFVNLFVVKNYWGYDVVINRVDEFPLIRKKNGTHTYPKRTYNVFMNNGSLDDDVISDGAVRYLYEQVYKIKDYSIELGDAKDAIKQIKGIVIDANFDEYSELLSKVLVALELKKLSAEDIENEPIILVENQKTGLKKIVSPKEARLGTWVRTNGDFDLYTLLKGVSVDLLDARYNEKFGIAKLKLLGCLEGLDYYEMGIQAYLRSLGISDYYYAKYVRPLPGRANNRQFKPLQQMRYIPEMLEAPMTIEKSIQLLRLAKEFDNQIVDWIEWSSRADYSQIASCKGYNQHYSAFGLALHTSAWLYNKDMKRVKPTKIDVDSLSPEYKKFVTSDIAEKLGIRKSQTEAMEILKQQLLDNGFFAVPLEQKDKFERFLKEQEQQEKAIEENYSNQLNQERDLIEHNTPNRNLDHDSVEDIKEANQENVSSVEEQPSETVTKELLQRIPKTGHSIIESIVEKTTAKTDLDDTDDSYDELETDIDDDELIPRTVDYEAQKKKKEKSYAAEIKVMQHKDDLQKIAVNAKKYSYIWFKTLLEMESLTNGETNANRKEVSITFTGAPEKEAGKSKTLILKNPDSHIPAFIEDLADMPLYFYDGEKETKVIIDVASVKSYTLRVKLKSAEDLERIDLSSVKSVKLEAKSPAFLLEELRKQFNSLAYDDDFDMRENLCENIDFVFGPPGTGKTTYLANKLLLPLMKQNVKCKVLVLTPTNKAADVITRRIIECSGADISYESWLVRFGSTGDEDIENSNIYYHKDYDIDRCSKSVTITTIDRFPYDFFMPQNKGVKLLQDVDWDLIVIDEASMIPIAKIVYPLYKKKPRNFVIAGDPFQIEPIASISLWKDENIYKMVNLDSFANPKTVPHQYKIITLTTQYRSIPAIGEIFSQFAYNGILSHYRKTKEQKQLIFGKGLSVNTLNIIKFPVSKYESIYRSKQLNRSSYQIYSALFTYEYAMFLAHGISDNNPNTSCKIGIIAPYRAEADLIHKLVSAEKTPERVEIQVGTIHGFQGDECDIVIAVFNAPPGMSNSDEMFLNKKTIMNVAISRARDYLFVIMPDKNTEKIENLVLVNRIERLMKKSSEWTEFNSHDIEKAMFDDPLYLEKNSFATSHQSVNVYGLPENKYEVRAEDSAVDIQVHKTTIDSSGNSKPELSILNVPEELQRDADTYMVDGDIRGEYYIAPYEGKLAQYSTEVMNQMFFLVNKNGQEKRIPVKVDENNRIIYISKPDYQRNKVEFAVTPVLKIKYRL